MGGNPVSLLHVCVCVFMCMYVCSVQHLFYFTPMLGTYYQAPRTAVAVSADRDTDRGFTNTCAVVLSAARIMCTVDVVSVCVSVCVYVVAFSYTLLTATLLRATRRGAHVGRPCRRQFFNLISRSKVDLDPFNFLLA